MALAAAAGAGRLLQGPVVDRLAKVCLPRLGEASCGVPGVQADEIVPDEVDGQEQCRRDEPGLSEEAAVDAQPLVAVSSDEAFDEGAPVERQRPPGGLPRVLLPIAFEQAVWDGEGLPAPALLAEGAGRGGDGVRHPHRRGGIGTSDSEGVPVDGRSAEALGAALVFVVNGSHVEVRRRFSVAHEIGHLELHEGRPIIVDHLVRGRVNMRDERSSLATSREEIEANGFAAALLMPADWIAADIEGSLGVAVGKTVESLARRYNVSTQAVEYRLVNLGYRSAP